MNKFYYIFGEGSKINQIICAILINLPVFAYGASIGWMSPMTLLLQSKESPRGTPLTDSEVSLMGAVAYLVCVPSDFLVASMADRIGRKYALLFISSTSLACWIMKLSSMEVWAFVTARALIGINMAGCYVVCPMYTKEISEDCIRGVLGCLVILFHTTGNLFLYIIGDILSYRTILWICLALPAVHLMLFLMMPESPSYLVKKGKLDEAARVLAWLRCRNETDAVVTQEVESMRREQKKDEESSKFVVKAIVSDRIIFRAFRMALVVAVAREVCGAIPVINFAGDIFTLSSEGTSLVLSPNQQAMMLGGVQVIGATIGSSIVEKAGRKPLLFTTALVSGLSMCTLASWFVARGYGLSLPGWIPITTLCLCIFCDASGLLPVSVVFTGEIFSFKYRSTVMAITMAAASFMGFLQMLFFKKVAISIGIHVSFYFFGAVCISAAIYVFLVVPETKNKSLEVIYRHLRTKKEMMEDDAKEIEAAKNSTKIISKSS